jgi:selenide,water dikinase
MVRSSPRHGAARHIVLVGGGHAHLHVLVDFARRPEPGVQLTLITREPATLYSGMLPGVVAGLYSPEQAHIDLARLAAATGARFVRAEAVGLDRAAKHVVLRDHAPVGYDVVSLDVGVAPDLGAIRGAEAHAVAVKPIGEFLAKLERLRARCRAADGPQRIAVVGGGAGGVELILSLRTRLLADAAIKDRKRFSFALVTAEAILPTHNPRVRAAFRRIFAERAIALHEHQAVTALEADAMVLAGGRRLAADAVLLATPAAAPAWFATTGLGRDPRGFLAVGPTLQAIDDADVFAAGDCAALIETPRAKAGVYAVRAGPPLARNLRRRVRREGAKPWWPPARHLALISTGERYAIASRGRFKAEGAWVWRLKDFIDRRWVGAYQDLDRQHWPE